MGKLNNLHNKWFFANLYIWPRLNTYFWSKLKILWWCFGCLPLKLSLNKRKLLPKIHFIQIFANLKKQHKQRFEQENAVVVQLGYPRYQNNPLCKTVVWCRIQSYFKDLPKENWAKWEKSPSCFILQNKPSESVLKTLWGGGGKGPVTTVPPTQSFLLFSCSQIHLTWIRFNTHKPSGTSQMFRAFAHSFGEVEPSFSNSPINDWGPTGCVRLHTEMEHIEIFWPQEPQTIEESNQDANRGLSLCRYQAAIQTQPLHRYFSELELRWPLIPVYPLVFQMKLKGASAQKRQEH